MKKKSNIWLYAEVFVFMMVIMAVICKILHVAPFGGNTFATRDADIQYLDFFAYLKDVLNGKQSIQYTFGKTLGGNNIAVFGYYLSSPLNLLVLLFEKSQLEVFYTLLVSLKLSLAAVAGAVFIKNRYPKLQNSFVIIFALSYGLMQYNMAQICNAMWLDGVIMLPFLLLAVHWLVQKGDKLPLMVTVGLAILFNWYTGAIDCLFSVIWFVYEVLRENQFSWENRKIILHHILHYIYAMIVGVFLSCILFVPVVFAMMGGRAGIDFSSLREHYYWGNFLSFIPKLVLGSESEYAGVSLYCGSIPVMGTIAYFMSKKVEKREKICHAILLLVTISLFYVPVFILLFGLLKDVSSYWYRYSYVGIFTLLVIAAEFFANHFEEEKSKVLCKAAVFFALVVFAMEYANPVNAMSHLYVMLFVMALFCGIYFLECHAKQRKVFFSMCLVLLSAGELICNAKVMNNVVDHADDYEEYTRQEEKLVADLQAYDQSFYRVNQTKTRNEERNHLTANYNEALAFGYHSVSGYTSDPDDFQRDFLNQLGYNICGDNMNIVNTSMIGADSLMNVKYILSDYEINGLKKIDKIGAQNGKAVYENPFVLPLAFSYPASDSLIKEENSNPFLYQNEVYSKLTGRKVTIYKPLDYERTDGDNAVSFQLHLPGQEAAVYGYCDMTEWGSGDIYVDDAYISGYNQWLAPRVIYVPCNTDSETAEVRIEKENCGKAITDSQFYYLDLKELQAVTDEIQQKQAKDIKIENKSASMLVENAKEGESLYVAIPYEKGWTILQNGKEIEPELIGNCMMSIPLQKGKNQIEMTYQARGIWIGRIVSILGVLAVLYETFRQRRGNGS